MNQRLMTCLFRLLAVAMLVSAPQASAEPADIDAAARGVVRVVIVSREGGELVPISHGTGFAISPERIVTNAHVVMETREDADLAIAIVPSDGENAVYGRLLAFEPGKDLALIGTTAAMGLPPLTLAGGEIQDSGSVTAVGYPMNVDRAQGLDFADLFRAQPPVKSTGFLSGRRPIREFDSLLHTATIARGNSGGPLLDECGRVLGVNSFGTESVGADGEFYFAVSVRELAVFLRDAGVTARINGLPCRSIGELDAEEQQRSLQDRADAAAREELVAQTRDETRAALVREAEFAVLAERDNAMALAMVALMLALAAGGFGYLRHVADDPRGQRVSTGIAVIATLAAAVSWFTRPGFGDIETRVADRLMAQAAAAPGAAPGAAQGSRPPREGDLLCVLDPERSRITGAATDDVPLTWRSDGCVNDRTQYGFMAGQWSRVLVPASEAAVSIARFDPATGEYRTERYLLPREAMDRARAARAAFTAPACGAGQAAAAELGAQQQAVVSLLPARPNERLVYRCASSR
jgi:S1-C subfamily serine protease